MLLPGTKPDQNERICASAIYYYDSENITESNVAFRQRADQELINETIVYEEGRHEFLYEVFGFSPEVDATGDTQITQDLGSVVCREGRLLTYPNTLQDRVSPFSLADPSKPGHHKILALFLVDPDRRIFSSANVPPQQANWELKWKVVKDYLSQRLPPELLEMVRMKVQNQSLTASEARKYRLELTEEKSMRNEQHNRWFESGNFELNC